MLFGILRRSVQKLPQYIYRHMAYSAGVHLPKIVFYISFSFFTFLLYFFQFFSNFFFNIFSRLKSKVKYSTAEIYSKICPG